MSNPSRVTLGSLAPTRLAKVGNRSTVAANCVCVCEGRGCLRERERCKKFYTQTHVRAHTHARTHAHTHARTHAHAHTHTHTHTHTNTQTHKHTHTHTHLPQKFSQFLSSQATMLWPASSVHPPMWCPSRSVGDLHCLPSPHAPERDWVGFTSSLVSSGRVSQSSS